MKLIVLLVILSCGVVESGRGRGRKSWHQNLMGLIGRHWGTALHGDVKKLSCGGNLVLSCKECVKDNGESSQCNGDCWWCQSTNTCQPKQEKCKMIVKECVPAEEQPCVFPFKFNNKKCNGPGCCNLDGDSKGAWCATKVDKDGYYMKGHWAYCSGEGCGKTMVDKLVSKPTKPVERVRPRYCQDLHGACPMWAYQNFCESASWKDYMFYRCCKSCTGMNIKVVGK